MPYQLRCQRWRQMFDAEEQRKNPAICLVCSSDAALAVDPDNRHNQLKGARLCNVSY